MFNLYNGILENCLGWYTEEVVRSIFGAQKIFEERQGSSLDLQIPGNPTQVLEIKSCRWSNSNYRTVASNGIELPTGRKYPVGRSMYYLKRNQLLEANLLAGSTPSFYAFVDYDFRNREHQSFAEVRDEIRRDFVQQKCYDPDEAMVWFGEQVVIKGIWLIPIHYVTHIWNTNVATTRTDRGMEARRYSGGGANRKYTQFYFKWALKKMATDLEQHGNIPMQYTFTNIQAEPLLVKTHSSVGHAGRSKPVHIAEGRLF